MGVGIEIRWPVIKYCLPLSPLRKGRGLKFNGVPHLLVRTGWRYHRHKKGCHRFTLHFWFFRFAFVNVRRQVLQECRAFALLLLVVIDGHTGDKDKYIYIYTLLSLILSHHSFPFLTAECCCFQSSILRNL